MQFSISKRGSKFVVVNTNTGRVLGTHPTRSKAKAQLRTLYASKENLLARLKAIEETMGNQEPGNLFPFNDGMTALLEYIEDNEVWKAFEKIHERTVRMECKHEFTDRMYEETVLRAEQAEAKASELEAKLAELHKTKRAAAYGLN